MGNEKSTRKLYNETDIPTIRASVENRLNSLNEYYSCLRQEKYINFDNFTRYILNSDQTLSSQIFQVLTGSKEQMKFEEFVVFYYVFQNPNELNNIRTRFWLNMLFSCKDEIPEAMYKKNVELFFDKSPELLQQGYINSFKSNNQKGSLVNRTIFLQVTGFNKIINFYSKIEKKTYKYSSKLQPFDRNNCYICDCCNQEKKKKEEEEKKLGLDKNKKEILSTIEYAFKKIVNKNAGVFPIGELDKILIQMKLGEIQRNVFLRYVDKITNSKKELTFNEFIGLLNKVENANIDEDKRLELVFEILSLQDKDIKPEDINPLVQETLNDQSVSFDTPLTLDEFKHNQNLFAIHNLFKKFFNNFNLIPFIVFNCKPKEHIQIKQCIDFYCDGMKISELTPEFLLQEEKLTFIDNEFVKSLYKFLKSKDYKNIPVINTRGFYEYKKFTKKYKEDFYLIPNKLKDFLINIFECFSNLIEFKRIEYDIKENIEEYKSKNKDILILYSEENGHFKEIEVYLWTLYLYSFKGFYESYMRNKKIPDNILGDIENYYKDNENQSSKGLLISRKQTIQKFLDDNNMRLLRNYKNVKVYSIKNNEINLIDQSKTIEELGENGYCHLMIDNDFTDYESGLTICAYDALFKRDEFLALKEKAIKEKEEKENQLKEEREKKLKEEKEEKEKREKEKEEAKEKENVNEDKKEALGSKEEITEEIKLKDDDKDKKEEKEEEKFCLPFGLNNIGNTCYMNSILQILLNLPILAEILNDERIKYFINRRSKFSHKGEFLDLFLKYINFRWKPRVKRNGESITPKPLKEIAGKLQNQFNNYDQQDANEFLNFVIDELHEELNIKVERPYIRNLEDCFFHNSEEELSNFYWSNSLRKSTSFINAIFSFQLKSVLTCSECNKQTISYETNTDLYAPVPMGKYIDVTVTIYKLPIVYKLYYDSINKEFKEFKDSHNELNYSQIINAFFNEREEKDKNFNIINYSIPVTTTLTLDKTKKISDFINIMRSIKVLEFESENNILQYERNEYKYPNKVLTSFIVCTYGNHEGFNFFYEEMTIDESFPNNSKIYVFEVLNANGIAVIRGIKDKSPILVNKKVNAIKKETHKEEAQQSSFASETPNEASNESTQKKNDDDKDKILSLNTFLYYKKKKHFKELESFCYEFPIEILHFKQVEKKIYLFCPFNRNQINFNIDFLLFNNSQFNFSGRELYEYIWEKYRKFLKDPNKNDEILWWRSPNEDHKNCYPFTLKLCRSNGREYICSKCKWFNFCNGCIIEPNTEKAIAIDFKDTLIIEWCGLLEEEELDKTLISKKNTLVETDKNGPAKYIEPEKSIDDCISLFQEKETLDDELKCGNCNKMTIFYKNYQFDKLPPVLFITLKRFKFTSVFHNKINTYIQYPIYDLKINSELFDLYGVVNHFGFLSGGHYTSIAKVDNKWLYFNDSSVYEINEDRVLSMNAYILVYINKKPLEQQMYLSVMKSLMNKLNVKECDEFIKKNKDKNLFIEANEIFGEPVNTIYGNGYFIGERDDGFIEVQFAHGKGAIKREYKGKRQIEMATFMKVGANVKDEVQNEKKNYNSKSDKNNVNNEMNNQAMLTHQYTRSNASKYLVENTSERRKFIENDQCIFY